MIKNELLNLIASIDTVSVEVANRFTQRINEGNLTREEDPRTHLCAMVASYDRNSQKIYIVYHKKSGLWLFPGGHFDKGEDPITCVDREGTEELGLDKGRLSKSKLFWYSIIEIENPTQRKCRVHFDFFFVENIQPSEIKVDMEEFHDTGWFSFEEARHKITSPYYLEALSQLQKYLRKNDRVEPCQNI